MWPVSRRLGCGGNFPILAGFITIELLLGHNFWDPGRENLS
ncbi:hypothetical protein [Streptomyces chartreusis]